MESDAAFEHPGQVLADELLLFGTEREWIGRGQLPGQFGGHAFGGLAERGKDQDRPQVFRQRFCDQAGPVSANAAGHLVT